MVSYASRLAVIFKLCSSRIPRLDPRREGGPLLVPCSLMLGMSCDRRACSDLSHREEINNETMIKQIKCITQATFASRKCDGRERAYLDRCNGAAIIVGVLDGPLHVYALLLTSICCFLKSFNLFSAATFAGSDSSIGIGFVRNSCKSISICFAFFAAIS